MSLPIINLDMDTREANEKLTEIEQRRAEALSAVNHVISAARSTYLIGVSVVKAMGGTVSTFFSSLISMGLSTISILQPLIQAKLWGSMSPYDKAEAIIAMINMGLAISALIAAQSKKTQIAGQIRNAMMGLHGVQNMLGNFSRS